MSMIHLTRPLALALCLSLTPLTPLLAQETAAPAADAGAPAAAPVTDPNALSLGTEPGAATDGVGANYTAATFGDWEQRCVRTEDGADPCQLYQLLKDQTGNPVAEITMFGLPAGQKAEAGATIIAPLETLLTEQMLLKVDSGKGKLYPFSWCAQVGCFARVGFTAEEVAGFKKGNAATITIVPVVAPDQKVVVTISLKGFTDGYEAVNAANAKAKPAEQPKP